MSLSTYFKRIQIFTHLAETTQTGTPKEVSDKLEVSLRTFHELKDQLMSDFEKPIVYHFTSS